MDYRRGKQLLRKKEKESKEKYESLKSRNKLIILLVCLGFTFSILICLHVFSEQNISKNGIKAKAFVTFSKKYDYMQDTGYAYTWVHIQILEYTYIVNDELYSFQKEIRQSDLSEYFTSSIFTGDSILIKYSPIFNRQHIIIKNQ